MKEKIYPKYKLLFWVAMLLIIIVALLVSCGESNSMTNKIYEDEQRMLASSMEGANGQENKNL